MDIEEQSIEFLEKQIDENFNELCEQYIVEDVVWDDFDMEGQRAYMLFMNPNPNKPTPNIIALCPPFYPKPR